MNSYIPVSGATTEPDHRIENSSAPISAGSGLSAPNENATSASRRSNLSFPSFSFFPLKC